MATTRTPADASAPKPGIQVHTKPRRWTQAEELVTLYRTRIAGEARAVDELVLADALAKAKAIIDEALLGIGTRRLTHTGPLGPELVKADGSAIVLAAPLGYALRILAANAIRMHTEAGINRPQAAARRRGRGRPRGSLRSVALRGVFESAVWMNRREGAAWTREKVMQLLADEGVYKIGDSGVMDVQKKLWTEATRTVDAEIRRRKRAEK